MTTQAADKVHIEFNSLYNKYHEKIRRAIALITKDCEDVEDLTQEVFLKAYAGLEKFRGYSSTYTWLYRIALNTVSTYKKQQDRRSVEIQSAMEEVDMVDELLAACTSTTTPEDGAAYDEATDRLFRAVEQLPDEYHVTFMLREVAGLTYEDICVALDISMGTAKSRVSKAKSYLRKKLDPEHALYDKHPQHL